MAALNFSEIASPAASSAALLILSPEPNFSRDLLTAFVLLVEFVSAFIDATLVFIRKPIVSSIL